MISELKLALNLLSDGSVAQLFVKLNADKVFNIKLVSIDSDSKYHYYYNTETGIYESTASTKLSMMISDLLMGYINREEPNIIAEVKDACDDVRQLQATLKRIAGTSGAC